MTNGKINLAIVDEHRVFRKAITSYLSQFSEINISIEAANGNELLQLMKHNGCNVVLLDFHVSALNGIETIKTLQEDYPGIKIIVLSIEADLEMASQLLDLGIHGYLSKSDEPEDLYHAVKAVHNDRVYRNKLLTEALYFAKYSNMKSCGKTSKKIDFDNREVNILKLLWEEKCNKEIASEIFLGIRSVEKIRQDMKKKLGVTTTVGLLKYALKNKLIMADQVPVYAAAN